MSGNTKIMFEIYREAGGDRQYRVVYYTELSPRNRDFSINQALAGISIFDGYVRATHRDLAGKEVDTILEELNRGKAPDRTEILRRLGSFLED